jgi:anthraniloyl-CoA monooxygenase
MRIAFSGGGPAGLYAALLLKQRHPQACIEVFEKNPERTVLGSGLILPEGLLDQLYEADAVSAASIAQALITWNTIDVDRNGSRMQSGGHTLSGMARQDLVDILKRRCTDLGVLLQYDETFRGDDARANDYDLIVAADGVHSSLRESYSNVFKPKIQEGLCHFLWLSTSHISPALLLNFQTTPHGWFHAHSYPYSAKDSAFIVEAPAENWASAGLLSAQADDLKRWVESTFAAVLQGRALHFQPHTHRLLQPFKQVQCDSWVVQNGKYRLVLMGDAAHTTHFSIGSGTRLALEDAIALAQCLNVVPQSDAQWSLALHTYAQQRMLAVRKLQNAARNSQAWFESVALRENLPMSTFAYSAITRSQRMSHEDLRRRDPDFIEAVEQVLTGGAPVCVSDTSRRSHPTPPMLLPFQLRDVRLKNRIVVSPMAQYQAHDGLVGDYHLMHLGARALGGAGLVMTEMTSVSPQGRITPSCAGIWRDDQAQAWRRIVDAVHQHSDACIGIQLGHAGPKGSVPVPWADTVKLHEWDAWPLISASEMAFEPGKSALPRAMNRQDMDAVIEEFKCATHCAAEAGFDWLELHCAHGYLLSAFISPLTNHRTDEYGGNLQGRLRYPLEVFSAVRSAWPGNKPISVRISAHDWVPGGTTPDDAVAIAKAFKMAGADMMDCSSGQVSPLQQPVYGRLYQTPLSDQIRHAASISTIAVGAISDADQVNGILAAGRADLCAIGRPHLAHPAWTLDQAARMGYDRVAWPPSYRSGQAWAQHYFQANR